jgi:hypothetical protein
MGRKSSSSTAMSHNKTECCGYAWLIMIPLGIRALLQEVGTMLQLWYRSLKAPALLYSGCLMFIGYALYTLIQ